MSDIKIKVVIILILLFSVITPTFCIFTTSIEKTGNIQTTELSTTFLDNSTLLTKVQTLDSSITSLDKNNDLNRVNTPPAITLGDNNVVSTSNSSVPIYLWIDNGIIYYYTAAVNIDLNNN